MATVTLQNLIDDSKFRAGMVGSEFVSDPEWTSIINASMGDLYDLILLNYGDEYFAKTGASVAYSGSTTEISLPGDFLKLISMEYRSSAGWKSMKGFQFAERNSLKESGASFEARMIYVPELTKLAILSDECSFKNSWVEYVVIKTAMKARDAEESDVSVLMAELQAKEAMIIRAAPKRDLSTPRRVIDVEKFDYCFEEDNGPRYCLQGDSVLIRYSY